MIHFNELKSNARSMYETFKKVLEYDAAITQAINSVCSPFTHEQVLLAGKAFTSMDEVKDFIRQKLDEEVNVIVEEGTHFSLTDSEGHIDWYRPKRADDRINFRFWKRYRKYLTHIKGWAETSVDKIDTISDEIMEDIEDPTVTNRPFDRRGLVVGYVQSGKTANFMGIINKAIDSGYRIVIVLAGMHENLRQQTQERIDEEVLGIDTNPEEKQKRIGVSTLPGEMYYPIDYFTESNLNPKKNGDFNKKKRWGTPPSIDRPIIFVVKKNKSVLNNLRDYFQNWISIFDEDFTYKKDGANQFNNLPLLIIDDESDQASVNTKASRDREGEELDPTAINNCIRQILNLFRQKIYIGYTATPFANIFIHHDNQHTVLGRDLFPFAFIKTLGAPSNYLGPKEVFGLREGVEEGFPIYREVNDAGQPLIEAGLDNFTFMPIRHQPDYIPTEIPNSLNQALKTFIISSAIRWHRGQEHKHNTMLIHCTRYNSVQSALAELVNNELTVLRNAILSGDVDVLNEMQVLYEIDFIPTSLEMDKEVLNWNDVIPFLSKAVRKIEPKCLIINGDVKDILDYKAKSQTGLSVIAIGGDKLSRGLTLEGLTISYFTRNTSLYDTLMQMGRWFGYRNGFEDLCRIYTTAELFSWYRHISTAFEVLRSEFIEMTRLKLTPKDFGLRVEDHPDLMVTNVMKMRAAETMLLNYQGTLTETTTLPSNEEILKSNYHAAEDFILSLGKSSTKELIGKNVWLDVSVNRIQEFLKNFQTYKGLPAANSVRINQYIEFQKQNEISEFLKWNVVLVSLEKNAKSKLFSFAGREIVLPERKITERRFSNEKLDRYFVQRMHDPVFEFSDYSKTEKKNIDDNHLTNREARSLKPRKNSPLLMIYVLSLADGKPKVAVNFKFQPVGFAISWCASSQAIPISYVINSVYQELEMNEND
ncbi:MAG: Z1 domain-containing protein [Bacteroidales bacterium]|nr:Z1 domain-containing protein [Bacteroidales bacterium]